jgi:hypothetical protein
LNREHIGILRRADDKWKISEIKSQSLANALGGEIEAWYNAR